MDIYLLPGLGTDRRLFSRLGLDDARIHYLEWPNYGPGWTLERIAEALLPAVDSSRPHILAGVSMGGMVAQELAMRTGPERVVLISSWTGPHEWPRHVRIAKTLRLHHLVTEATMRAMWPLKQWLIGGGDPAIDRLLFDMACAQTARRVRCGMDAVLRWKGSRWKGPVVRIHGGGDRLMPLRFPVEQLVPHGSHSMVVYQPDEVRHALLGALGGPLPSAPS